MLRLTLSIVALALGFALAFALGSCGGRDEKGLLPGTTADQIVANLDQVEQDAADGNCDSAAAAADAVQLEIEQLGSEVNAQLRQRLADGVERLQQTITNTCEEDTASIPTVSTTTAAPTTTEKTTTKSTTTTTTPTTTSTSTTTTPTTTTPPTGGTPGGGGVVPPSGATP